MGTSGGPPAGCGRGAGGLWAWRRRPTRSTSMTPSRPRCSEAKSPAAITTSTSRDRATRRRAWSRSRWRSLNASSLKACNTRTVSSWQRALICLSVLLALALLAPASALAGGSAGDQQYIDPLGGQNPNSGSHHSSGSGGSTTPATAPAPSTPSSTSTPTTSSSSTGQTGTSTSSSTGTTAAVSGTSSPTATSSSATAVDPAGKTLPRTGFDAWAGALVGLGLLGIGLVVRRVARRA
jgi:LPXTG-motif cell wall-anchored protein